ncbi:MAG: hypothetical protein ACRDIB_05300, partial [Ardenticatenaceae bacterium]
LGGAAVLVAAHSVPACEAVATIGGPAEPAHVTRHLLSNAEEIGREGEATVLLAGRPFKIKKQFLQDIEKSRMEKLIATLRRALLICHAPRDQIVGIDNAAHIFQAARHPKSFLSLADADHLLTDERDSRYVGAMIASWARRYIRRPTTDY